MGRHSPKLSVNRIRPGRFAGPGWGAAGRPRRGNLGLPLRLSAGSYRGDRAAPATVESNPQRRVARRHNSRLSEVLHHCDIKAINEFYGTPTGQKLLKNMNAMMMDSMQPAQSVMNKYMPEIEAQIEKAGTNVPRPE